MQHCFILLPHLVNISARVSTEISTFTVSLLYMHQQMVKPSKIQPKLQRSQHGCEVTMKPHHPISIVPPKKKTSNSLRAVSIVSSPIRCPGISARPLGLGKKEKSPMHLGGEEGMPDQWMKHIHLEAVPVQRKLWSRQLFHSLRVARD